MSKTGKFIILIRRGDKFSPSGPIYRAPLNQIYWSRFIKLVIEDLELRDVHKNCLEELKKVNPDKLNDVKLNNGGLFTHKIRVDRID